MLSKKVFLALFVLSVVFLAGCTGGGNTSGTKTPFCGGFDAVDMKFVEGYPPSEVFDNRQYPFDVTLRLFNKGEYDIPSGQAKIELSGISNIDFGGPSYSKIINEPIVGTRKDQNGNCVSGTPSLITFGDPEERFNYKHILPGNTEFTVRADLCFKYATQSSVQFCVQKDLEVPRFGQEPPCKVNDVKPVSSSGAPVQVENFKQNLGGDKKLTFSFDVVHKGVGLVHSGQLCDSSFQALNKVHVKVSSSVGVISCSGLSGRNEGYVLLIDENKQNKRPVNCIMDISSLGVNDKIFETPVNIELEYNYKQHDDVNVLVKHLG